MAFQPAIIPKSEKVCDTISTSGIKRSGKSWNAAELIKKIYWKRCFVIDPQLDWDFGNSKPHKPNYVDFGGGRGNHVYYWNSGYIVSDNPRKNTAIKYILSHPDQTNYIHVFRTANRYEIEYIYAMAMSLGHMCLAMDEIYRYVNKWVETENSEVAARIKGLKIKPKGGVDTGKEVFYSTPSLFVDLTNNGSHQAISTIGIATEYIKIPPSYRDISSVNIFFNQGSDDENLKAAWKKIPKDDNGRVIAKDKDGKQRYLIKPGELAYLKQGERIEVIKMFEHFMGDQNLKTFRY